MTACKQITETDIDIANWIRKIKAVKTEHIMKYWYRHYKSDNSRKVQVSKRINSVMNYGKLKRDRDHINMQYIYYTCQKRHIEHQLILANFIVKLSQVKGRMLEDRHWQMDYCIGDIIADIGLVYQGSDGMWHMMFVECHHKSNAFDYMKYEKLYTNGKYEKFYKDFFGKIPKGELPFPKVVIISDRKIEIGNSDIKYIQIDSECRGIRKVFG